MFRALLAAAFVSIAFGAALYFSGDYLQAWESPEPAAQAAPDAHKKAKRKRSAPRPSARKRSAPVKPGRKAPAQPAWLGQLNALCRRTEAQAAAIPPPLTEAGLGDFFRQFEGLNRRFNRRAAVVLRTADNPKAARLVSLFDDEERLLSTTISAIRRHRLEEWERLRPRLLAVARSENKLLKGLGARDCTVSEDPFDS